MSFDMIICDKKVYAFFARWINKLVRPSKKLMMSWLCDWLRFAIEVQGKLDFFMSKLGGKSSHNKVHDGHWHTLQRQAKYSNYRYIASK